MKWGLAACCVIAVAGMTVGVGRREGEALKADARAKADAKAKADADAKARADAKVRADADAKADAAHEAAVAEAIEQVAVEGDLPAYVVRPAARTRVARAVFLTGSCTHPLAYVKAFQRAAAEHGGLVALQGDLACRDGSRRWSADAVLTSARIDAALQAAGVESASDVTIIGYSQGAERAEWLARRFPAKYTRFVLMAGPVVPGAARFSGAHAIVTLAGYGDVRENMADGAKRLRRASIPALYMELPGIQHGELSPAVDAVVARAFDWLDENAVAPGPKAPPHSRGARAKHPRPH
jgi:hypothetical protein